MHAHVYVYASATRNLHGNDRRILPSHRWLVLVLENCANYSWKLLWKSRTCSVFWQQKYSESTSWCMYKKGDELFPGDSMSFATVLGGWAQLAHNNVELTASPHRDTRLELSCTAKMAADFAPDLYYLEKEMVTFSNTPINAHQNLLSTATRSHDLPPTPPTASPWAYKAVDCISRIAVDF